MPTKVGDLNYVAYISDNRLFHNTISEDSDIIVAATFIDLC